ncbi:carbonic anhydrase [Asanoa ferruginea]|uniref:carbonic anhydrase n=1 Tax=Asanoa ferruginea TaxID=53367 RepID=UPI001EF37E4E|nr:carbonic anhydrase [Asanoa ferruginea]
MAGAVSLPAGPSAASAASAEDPVERLLAGNRRFRAGRARHPRQSPADVRRLAAGQRPFAVVLGCADSRVSPEVLFDQGLGDLFDNRVAGNVVDPVVLGSVEFAVSEFAPALLLVLGHERCGAITAAVSALSTGRAPAGSIGAVVEALRPAVAAVHDAPGDPVENAVVANVRHQAGLLTARSAIVQSAVAAGTTRVVGARYDLNTAEVTLV